MRVRFLLLSLALFCSCSSAGSPVWRVQHNGNTLFIGGTIHALASSDYPLPGAFDRAYKQAGQLIFETDMAALQAPETQLRMAREMLYDDGRTLQSVLNANTYQRLSEYLGNHGVPIEPLGAMRAGAVSMMLSILELQRVGLGGIGVDEFFSSRALSDHKELGRLETVDQQMAFLRQIGEGQEDAIIQYTLDDLGKLETTMTEMKSAWRRGDTAALDSLVLKPMREQFPSVFRTLLVERNNAWLPEIESMLRSTPVELVLVGALHLTGPEGIIEQLKRRGYAVKQL